MKRKKNNKPSDPFAAREAQKYSNPIASREHILSVLENSDGPLTHPELCNVLSIEDDDDDAIEALRRRLIAMVRDGQLISNRKQAFGPINKLDLLKGRVLAHREGYGFVRPLEGGDDIYLSNRQMRKVFDGDEVLVRKGEGNFRGQSEGAIVEVLQRNTSELAGRLVLDKGWCYVKADNPKIHHDIHIDPEQLNGASAGQIVVVTITVQPDRRQRPQGVIKEVLGDHFAPGMEIDVAIRSHNIPHEWPEPVVQQSKNIAAEVSEADKQHRVDLRAQPFVTIDGEDARDFDDAVYCQKKASGGWRLYVAIADVSHYVLPDSPLDLEAQNRGNSVYFPNHVVPMLPEVLSNGLCSLNPKVDRLSMVCEMSISAAGRISAYTFYEALIHSKARLSYTQVGKMLAGKAANQGKTDSRESEKLREHYASVIEDIDELHRLFHALSARRAERGAVEFETTETRIEFDENRKIQQIVPIKRNDAHRLIEECMLAANVCAARFLEQHQLPGLYRVHEAPKTEKLELLQTYLAGVGLSLPTLDNLKPSDYQQVLSSLGSRPDAHIIQTVMLRSMNQAVYQAANLGHFGLAYPAYAHFTSPIRRYPDLLVHRAIRSVIRSDKESARVKRVPGAEAIQRASIYPYTEANIESLGEQCSFTERRADEATRDVIGWLKCEYLRDRVGDTFSGVVSAVTGFGLFVELDDLFIEGLIHITSLPQDYYQYSAAKHSLIGERTNTTFKLGDALTVQVVRVSLDERKIDFELVQVKKSKTKSAGKKAANAKKVGDERAQGKPARVPRKRSLTKKEDGPKADDSENKDKGGKRKKKPKAPSQTKKKHSDKVKKSSTKKTQKKRKKDVS